MCVLHLPASYGRGRVVLQCQVLHTYTDRVIVPEEPRVLALLAGQQQRLRQECTAGTAIYSMYLLAVGGPPSDRAFHRSARPQHQLLRAAVLLALRLQLAVQPKAALAD